ncbi:MAG: BrnA antitoxin of type toxin-antitoxin system, partial [Pseudomonadota bacterium]
NVLFAFKATGKGWQTRMNDALKDWLNEHATG